MTKTLIQLLGRSAARELDKQRWICEMRILRSIQSRHPHWYQRLLSRDYATWLKIAKRPWYFDSSTRTTVYRPISKIPRSAIHPRFADSLCKAMTYVPLTPMR